MLSAVPKAPPIVYKQASFLIISHPGSACHAAPAPVSGIATPPRLAMISFALAIEEAPESHGRHQKGVQPFGAEGSRKLDQVYEERHGVPS